MSGVTSRFLPNQCLNDNQFIDSELIHIEKSRFGGEPTVYVETMEWVIENSNLFDESDKFFRTRVLTEEQLFVMIRKELEEKISIAIRLGSTKIDVTVEMPDLVAICENDSDKPSFYQFKNLKEHQFETTLERILKRFPWDH